MDQQQSREDRLALLKEVTGIDNDEVATFLLTKHNWDTQAAVQEYLSGGGGSSSSSLSSTTHTHTHTTSGSGNHVRRRSTSPGSERRIRARAAAAAAAAASQQGGGNSQELDDSMLAALQGGGAGGGGEGDNDNAPLLGRGGSSATAMNIEGGGGGGGGRGGGGAATAFSSSSSLVRVPFQVAGLVLRTVLAPVRYLTGGNDPPPDAARAAELFIEAYEKDYHCRGAGGGGGGGGGGGEPSHPKFLPMSFQEATRLAARESKFLVVYLHAPLHEDTPNFVRQTLNSEPFVSFVDENVLVWGGSIHFADAYLTSQHLDAAAFPFLALLACQPPQIQVLDHMEGVNVSVGVEGVLQRLTAAMARHQDVLERQLATQRERAERIRLQEEQNREYQEALEADRRREAEVAAERERQAQAAAEEKLRKEEEEQTKLAQQQAAAASIASKRARLPPEPAVGDKSAIRLRLQFPHGRKSDRRFSPLDTIGVVRDYIDVHVADTYTQAQAQEGEGGGERKLVNYALSTPYPKRTFDDVSLTLQEAGLHSADTIYIADLDA